MYYGEISLASSLYPDIFEEYSSRVYTTSIMNTAREMLSIFCSFTAPLHASQQSRRERYLLDPYTFDHTASEPLQATLNLPKD